MSPGGRPDRARLLASPAWGWCEALIRAFEAAWARGAAPAVRDYLQADGEAGHALLAELVHIDLEFRLKSGAPARVEGYLAEFPGLAADAEAVLELLAAEWRLRRRHGEQVAAGEYATRFPALHGALLGRVGETVVSVRPSAAPPAPAGPAVPGYEILEELGRGGMGVVYKARDVRLDRPVALKFLPDEFAWDPERLERFLREARTASALNHPNICTVHALGEHDGRPFIVMEYIEGRTLQTLLGQRHGPEALARLVGQAARALAAAHAAGVVHRDVKPDNVMVRPDGLVKVLDFGLARRLPALGRRDPRGTDPGQFLGTVAYASPEQARGEPAASASDVFSLGVVLYQLATGAHPFEAESPLGFLHAIAYRTPPPPVRVSPEVGGPLAALLEAMLQKDARLRPTAAEVERGLEALAAAPARAPPAERPTVGRRAEREALRAAWADAEGGRGCVLCVSGQPGIGKTALVEDFLRELRAEGRPCLAARGRCSERLAAAEAYLPVLEALEVLLGGPDGPSVARVMQAVAPTWYARASHAATTGEAPAASQPALLREFCGFVRDASRFAPVVLFLEDVHWADLSTLDLLAHFGRQCGAARVLVVLTYRPTEVLLGPHPFLRVKLELQAQGACRELALGLLSRDDVAAYLDLAFPGHAFLPDFAAAVHARTEGNPLFMADLLAYLRHRGVIAEVAGRWVLARPLPELWPELPESARGMIQRKLDLLSDHDRRLLAAAAVQGHAFDAVAVAGAVGRDPAEVEERLQALDRAHGLVRLVREYDLPDRVPTQRYRFVHVLYQQALYHDLPPTRRAALSTALARALDAHQAGASAAAAELACLYESGRDYPQAARQCHLAARNAAAVFAHHEAVELARRGLRLLEALPPSAERDALELPLRVALGMQLQVTEGFASAEVEGVYARARELCGRDALSPTLFPVLWGLWLFHKVRSELARAGAMADALHALAERLADPALAVQAQQALTVTALCRGEPAAAVRHMGQAVALYDPVRHRGQSSQFGQDPAVACQSFGAVASWLLGRPDEADRLSGEAVRSAWELGQPSTVTLALHFAAVVHQCRRDGRRALVCAELSRSIAAEHGFSFWQAGAEVLAGWALAAGGEAPSSPARGAPACGDCAVAGDDGRDGGLARLRRGLRDWRATGSVTYETYFLGLLAEVLGRRGEIDEGRRVLEEALALVRRSGEHLYEAELHRLGGELLLRGASDEGARRQAGEHFRRALEVARSQSARSLELRAAVSLARLEEEARGLLADVYGRFTEGLETGDLREARDLLARSP